MKKLTQFSWKIMKATHLQSWGWSLSLISFQLFVPRSCNSHCFLLWQEARTLHWYCFGQQLRFFSIQCMELAHLPLGTTSWSFSSKIQTASSVLRAWLVRLNKKMDQKKSIKVINCKSNLNTVYWNRKPWKLWAWNNYDILRAYLKKIL